METCNAQGLLLNSGCVYFLWITPTKQTVWTIHAMNKFQNKELNPSWKGIACLFIGMVKRANNLYTSSTCVLISVHTLYQHIYVSGTRKFIDQGSLCCLQHKMVMSPKATLQCTTDFFINIDHQIAMESHYITWSIYGSISLRAHTIHISSSNHVLHIEK